MSAFQIPVLETERLVMRAFRHDTDFEAYAEFYASERTRYYGGPLDRRDAWRAAATMMGHWVLRGYGCWAIEEKDTGDFSGMAGLWNPEGWPEREISWAVLEHKGGRGLASEATLRARRYAYETLGWQRAVSCISVNNTPSRDFVLKLGATYDRSVVHPKHGKMDIYLHPKP